MYRYTKKALMKDFASILLITFLTVFALYSQRLYWAGFGSVMLMLLGKDFYKISRLELVVKPDGLYERVGDKERCVMAFDRMLYITRTRKFNKFIVLSGTDRYYYYLKPAINEREKLVQEIVVANRGNKKLAVDHNINTQFGLGLKLNDKGNIKWSSEENA